MVRHLTSLELLQKGGERCRDLATFKKAKAVRRLGPTGPKERFVRPPPMPPTVPAAVWIDPLAPRITPGPSVPAAAGSARLETLGVR